MENEGHLVSYLSSGPIHPPPSSCFYAISAHRGETVQPISCLTRKETTAERLAGEHQLSAPGQKQRGVRPPRPLLIEFTARIDDTHLEKRRHSLGEAQRPHEAQPLSPQNTLRRGAGPGREGPCQGDTEACHRVLPGPVTVSPGPQSRRAGLCLWGCTGEACYSPKESRLDS